MKRLFTLLLAMVALSASAQSIRFIYDGQPLAANDTIHVELTNDDIGGFITYPRLGFMNTTAASVSYNMGLTDLNTNPDNVLAFCVSENCFPPEATAAVTLAANEIVDVTDSRSFHFNFEPAVASETFVKVYAVNQADATDVNGFYVRYYFSTVGIAERNVANALSAYPNPATTSVTITYSDMLSAGTQLVIKNITGAEVYNQPASSTGKSVVNTSNLKAGIYFYGLKDASGNMMCTKKLLVK